MKSKNLNALIVLVVSLFFASVVSAATPNPGHPWADVGDGTFQVTGPTVLRSYAFPDADATVVTGNSFSQGDLIYGSAAGTVSQLPKDTNASRYLSNSGASNNPAWAQINLTNGVSGILTSANGGTGNGFVGFSGPAATEKTFTLPNASASILTDNADVTVAQGGTGLSTLTANALVVGNGTGNPTFIAPGAATTYLYSNGTTWATASSSDPVMFTTVGLNPANLTAVTALTTGTTYFQFMGTAPRAYTSCSVLTNVTTAAVTITWAEVGVFRGTPNLNGTASLTRLGTTNVAATHNTTGRKSTAVTVAVNPGDPLWVAFGSSATTPFQVRGQLADDLQSGVFQTGAVRPSLAAIPFATTLAGNTTVPGWVTMKCI